MRACGRGDEGGPLTPYAACAYSSETKRPGLSTPHTTHHTHHAHHTPHTTHTTHTKHTTHTTHPHTHTIHTTHATHMSHTPHTHDAIPGSTPQARPVWDGLATLKLRRLAGAACRWLVLRAISGCCVSFVCHHVSRAVCEVGDRWCLSFHPTANARAA